MVNRPRNIFGKLRMVTVPDFERVLPLLKPVKVFLTNIKYRLLIRNRFCWRKVLPVI